MGLNMDRPKGPLCASPNEGNNSGPGGGELSPTAMPQGRIVCPLGGPGQLPPRHGYVHQGSVK